MSDFFENVNLFSSYDGLSSHQIRFDLDEGKQSYGGGGGRNPGHAKSYEIELQDNLSPLNHFTKTIPQTESHLEDLLETMKGFKFIETLEVTFEKDTIDSKTGKRVSIYKTAFFNGKAKTITKVDDIEPELNMSRQEILNVIDKWVSDFIHY